MIIIKEEPQLGFGFLRLPQVDNRVDREKTKKLVDEYMGGEFCYFDVHPKYMHGEAEHIVKEMVVDRYPRESYLLANKVPVYVSKNSDYDKYCKESLKSCGVTYFDYYLLHAITQDVYEKHEKLGGFTFLKEAKKKGIANQIGFSFHDKPELLEKILSKHPEIDFVQLQINYLDWENPVICSKECYEIARKYKKSILVMEPIKGGSLANKGINIDSDNILKNINLVEIALEFIKSLPGITIILSGMSEIDHIIENRKILKKTNNRYDEEVIERLRESIESTYKIKCTSCNYCIEECPQKIPIPQIMSLLNSRGTTERVYPYQKRLYHDYVDEKGMAGSCIKCKKCETLCPQKISIIANLKEAAKLFEKSSIEVKLNRAKYNYQILRDWMTVIQEGDTLESFFLERGYHTIAIYGVGEIGRLLLKEIKRYKYVNVKYGIDKKIKGIIDGIPIVETDNLYDVDTIIVTPTFDYEIIKKQLSKKVAFPIISLEEITGWALKNLNQ